MNEVFLLGDRVGHSCLSLSFENFTKTVTQP